MDVEIWKPPHRDADAAIPPPPPSKWRQIAGYSAVGIGFFAVTLTYLAWHDLAEWYHVRHTPPEAQPIHWDKSDNFYSIPPKETAGITPAQLVAIKESAASAQSAEAAANQAAAAARGSAVPDRPARQ